VRARRESCARPDGWAMNSRSMLQHARSKSKHGWFAWNFERIGMGWLAGFLISNFSAGLSNLSRAYV
jgi:hypothetical protein